MSFALSIKLLDVRLRQDRERKISQEVYEISLVISLLVNGKDVSSLEPPVLCEHPRSGLFVVDVTWGDTVSLDPKFARFLNTAIRTILTNDPSLQARYEKTDRLIDRFVPGDAIISHRSNNREGLCEFSSV